jgi:SpoVK/Ycf46/Vps4 family AAA+-type ATPase
MYELDKIANKEDKDDDDKDDVTEQDVAKALEEKGYSEDEIKDILEDAKQEKADAIENEDQDSPSPIPNWVIWFFGIVGVVMVIAIIKIMLM